MSMYTCIQPGCGYGFPEAASGKCPNCGESPFELDADATFSREEMRGRQMMFCHLPYDNLSGSEPHSSPPDEFILSL